jgi:hypothetical protein
MTLGVPDTAQGAAGGGGDPSVSAASPRPITALSPRRYKIEITVDGIQRRSSAARSTFCW